MNFEDSPAIEGGGFSPKRTATFDYGTSSHPWFCGEYSAKTEALQGKEEIRLPPYPGESLAFRIWMEMIQNGLNKNFTGEGCVFDVFFFLGKFA